MQVYYLFFYFSKKKKLVYAFYLGCASIRERNPSFFFFFFLIFEKSFIKEKERETLSDRSCRGNSMYKDLKFVPSDLGCKRSNTSSCSFLRLPSPFFTRQVSGARYESNGTCKIIIYLISSNL